jgi:LacI family transcriptional regulator
MPRTPPPKTAPTVRGPTSLADVAALAGVSAGTVSRVLSRPEMISEATRTRVLAAADRLGYVANGAARALAMRKTQTVGALVPRFGGSSFPTLVQALESALAAEGYKLLLSAPDHARAQDPAIIRTLLERGVDAVALLGAEQPASVFALLQAHRMPYVLMWAQDSAQGPCIGFDERAAAALVVDHLADLGHRQIGFIGGRTADNERARRRMRGVLEAVARRGLTLPADALVETDYGFREGFEAMQDLLRRGVPVSAVVCGNDYLAGGALSALAAACVAVPQRMSVASFNDNDFAAYLNPPLTTVRLPIRAMGEAAARHLIEQLAGRQPATPPLLPVQLIVRGSTAAAPR